MKYRAVIRSPFSTFPHSRCFEELQIGLNGALDDLGLLGPDTWEQRPGEYWRSTGDTREIVLGAHLPRIFIPHDAIIYNTEVRETAWFTEDYRTLLRRHEVWDYSAENVAWLIEQGIAARYCPIGYHPVLERIVKADHQDIDVLFYGSHTERREVIWRGIEKLGLNCVWLFGTYGQERDDFIAMSKVVLNMHFYEQAPSETVRLSYLWANKVCVVDEATHVDMARAVKHYLAHPHLRGIDARSAYEAFKQRPQVDILKALLVPEQLAAD
jgi:hypothetical protein